MPEHRYFPSRRVLPFDVFASHLRYASPVPYTRLSKVHAAYTPDTIQPFPQVIRCTLLSSGRRPSDFGIGESYSRCLIDGSLSFISFRLTGIHFNESFGPSRSAPPGLPPTAPQGGLGTVPVKPSLAVHHSLDSAIVRTACAESP